MLSAISNPMLNYIAHPAWFLLTFCHQL